MGSSSAALGGRYSRSAVLKTSDVAKETEIIGLPASPIAYQCFHNPTLTVVQGISVPFWLKKKKVFQFSVSTCIIWTPIVMPGARQSPGEANSGFRLCKHTTFSQLTGLSLRPERTDCSRPVITAVSLSAPHTPTCHHSNREEAKRLCLCTLVRQIKGLKKSPEKAFSSSWVTRVQVAPSRLINSSNEAWILNTYRWNRASTLAAWFHIMRTFQIAQLWLKHLVFNFFYL